MTYETLMLNFTFQNLVKYVEDNVKTSATISTETANQLTVIIKKIEDMTDKSLFDHSAQIPMFQWMRMGMTLKILLNSNKDKLTKALSKTHEEPTKVIGKD